MNAGGQAGFTALPGERRFAAVGQGNGEKAVFPFNGHAAHGRFVLGTEEAHFLRHMRAEEDMAEAGCILVQMNACNALIEPVADGRIHMMIERFVQVPGLGQRAGIAAEHILPAGVTVGVEQLPCKITPKNGLSSDCRLQLAYMKSELLVIADQHAAVNTFPGFVHTARQTMKVENTRSRWANRKEAVVEGGFNDWG